MSSEFSLSILFLAEISVGLWPISYVLKRERCVNIADNSSDCNAKLANGPINIRAIKLIPS